MDVGLHFASLRWLLILGPLFLAWSALFGLRLLGWWPWSRRSVLRFPVLAPSSLSRTTWRTAGRTVVRLSRWLVVGLLLLAVLRPQTVNRHSESKTEGIDIALVVDVSGSMKALDLDTAERSIRRRRNRLEVAKDVVQEFVTARTNDQIGLVVFGGEAFTQCPMTLDHDIVVDFIEQLEVGIAGEATAIGSALGTAVKRLEESEARSKVIVLLTDGRSNAGSVSPATAAEIAATFGIKVYAIAVGARGRAPFVVETRLGPQVVYQDVEIDEETLRSISEITGGAYFRAEDEEALAEIYRRIDELETTEITTQSFVEHDERFRWLVAPALLLLVLEILLVNSVFRSLP